MTPRYAIYYAPSPADPLHTAASAWLGRDAATGESISRVTPPGLPDIDIDALTADPRGYGFHATLKAPFELCDAAEESALAEAVAEFARNNSPFTASIAPGAVGEFIAFRIDGACPEMNRLEADCVRTFEPFRAPISAFDLERKRKAGLTPEQDAYLQTFGYPYIFEYFRFHMTLTGRIRDSAMREKVIAALKSWFAPVSGPHAFASLTLFKQDERGGPFRHLVQAPFLA